MENQQEEEVRLSAAKEELESWKVAVEEATKLNDKLMLEKLTGAEKKKKMQLEAEDWLQKEKESEKTFKESMSRVQDSIQKLQKSKKELLAKLEQSRAKLQANQAESSKLKQKSKVCTQLHTEVNFLSRVKDGVCYGDQPIKGVFTISQQASLPLQGGQALITFEEEKVASQVLKLPQCLVRYENTELKVNTQRLHLDPSVKFQVHLEVSRKEVKVSNVPPSMSEDRVKDRLEMSFSKPSRGGGEVEKVEYDKNTGIGHVVFCDLGVADGLAVRGGQLVDLDPAVTVQVGPVYTYKLCRFQTFQGVVRRTVLLDGIKDMGDEEDLQDHLEIHFQKPNNNGGEIDCIKYNSSNKSLLAFFNRDDEGPSTQTK